MTTEPNSTPFNPADRTLHNWEGMWQQEETPRFDMGRSAPSLVAHLERHKYPAGGRALVPGCGRGYDVVTFARLGLDATGLELSSTGAETARGYLASQGVDPAKGRVLERDFFKFDPAAEGGKYDVVYDYTFLCALPPGMRQDWASKMRELVKPGTGELITLIFPIDPTLEKGPPFRVSVEAVRELLEPVGFENIEVHHLPPEMSFERRRGREAFARWRIATGSQ